MASLKNISKNTTNQTSEVTETDEGNWGMQYNFVVAYYKYALMWHLSNYVFWGSKNHIPVKAGSDIVSPYHGIRPVPSIFGKTCQCIYSFRNTRRRMIQVTGEKGHFIPKWEVWA